MAQQLRVLGMRTQFTSDTLSLCPSRIVALDPVSLAPVEASWQYENDSNIVTGNAFFDANPFSKLTVSANGYDPVVLNANNINLIPYNAVCVITTDQTIAQWGELLFTSNYPVPAEDNHDIQQISTNYTSAFALRTDNSLIAWGDPGDGGQLKIDTESRTDIIKTLGVAHAGLLLGKTIPYVDSWGIQSTGIYQVPDDIQQMTGIIDLQGNASARAVLNNQGQVFAWGALNEGGLVPPHISALTDIVSLITNDYSFCALRASGEVVAWGLLENGGTVPDSITGMSDIIRVFPGAGSYVALRSDGSLVAWGADWDYVAIPAEIAALTNIVDVQHTDRSWVALCNDGTVVSWGDATTGIVPVPSGLNDVVSLARAENYCVALKADGSVVGWGANSLIDISTVSEQLTDVKAIYAISNNVVALKGNNTIVVWGDPACGGDMDAIPEGVQGNVAYLYQ